MNAPADLLLERQGSLAIITLNRPQALNALTLDMVRGMELAFSIWKRDHSVACVLVRGAGERGLCAGGDIRWIYESAIAGDYSPIDFWREEYGLNRGIADYPKPVVALMNGIVMGGGIGISAHAAHRVVTETTAIAMPEVSIGLIPDVGGTYLLSRAPGELGTHVALTGGRVGAADSILLDLADVFAPGMNGARLAELLADARSSGEVDEILKGVSAPPGEPPLAAARGWIDEVYSASAIEEICARLAARPEPEAAKALAVIGRNSPTSLKVTLRALRKGRVFAALAPCLDMELVLVGHCLRGHDLPEGIRAAVIDKDRDPRWSPATLAEVDEALVDSYFTPGKYSI